MAGRTEDWLEQPVTRVGRRADRGRWMPLAWAGGLAIVAGFAVAGQRLAVLPVAVAQPARAVIANVTPPPWVTSRRWAEDTIVRTPPAGGSNRLDRRWIRVFGRPVAPLVR